MITSNRIVRFLWHQPSFGPLQLHLFLFLTEMKAELIFSSKKKDQMSLDLWHREQTIQIYSNQYFAKKEKAIKKYETDMQDQKRPYQTMISLKKSKHCHSVFFRTFFVPFVALWLQFANIFCSFQNDSAQTTKLLLRPLSVARGQKEF